MKIDRWSPHPPFQKIHKNETCKKDQQNLNLYTCQDLQWNPIFLSYTTCTSWDYFKKHVTEKQKKVWQNQRHFSELLPMKKCEIKHGQFKHRYYARLSNKR